MEDPPAPAARLRQPCLIATTGPLAAQLGAETFAAIPELPGVYRFFGDADRLLYIGQSVNLRARVGSYRYVTAGKHSRRIARMVARARRVEWEVCESAAAAIALEARLLLEHSPPFNRAGVWMPPPWWLSMEECDGILCAGLTRGSPPSPTPLLGPLPSSFRYTFASLMRCVHRWHWPETAWWNLPLGMAGPVIPLVQNIPLSPREEVRVKALREFVHTGCPHVLELLVSDLSTMDPETPEGMFWLADGDELRKFSARRSAAGILEIKPADTAAGAFPVEGPDLF